MEQQNQSMEQLDALAMHITDNYMTSVVARSGSMIDAESYTEMYFDSYERIKKSVYQRHGFVEPIKLNSFIDDNDSLANTFK